MGQPWRSEILKHLNMYPAVDGTKEFRGPQTWREAHDAFVFLQGSCEDSKAVVAATTADEEDFTVSESKRNRRRRNREKEGERPSPGGALADQEPPDVAMVRLPDHLKRVCFRAVNNPSGECDTPGCTWDHETPRVKEARTLMYPGGLPKGKGGSPKGGAKGGTKGSK